VFLQPGRTTGPAGNGVADAVNKRSLNGVGHPLVAAECNKNSARTVALLKATSSGNEPQAAPLTANRYQKLPNIVPSTITTTSAISALTMPTMTMSK
jgi:hypothetical protein